MQRISPQDTGRSSEIKGLPPKGSCRKAAGTSLLLLDPSLPLLSQKPDLVVPWILPKSPATCILQLLLVEEINVACSPPLLLMLELGAERMTFVFFFPSIQSCASGLTDRSYQKPATGKGVWEVLLTGCLPPSYKEKSRERLEEG